MRKQHRTFTFYKFLSIILILILSISTTISLAPNNNITVVEAKNIDPVVLNNNPTVAPLNLVPSNKIFGNALISRAIMLPKLEEAINIEQQTNESSKVEEVTSTITESTIENTETKEESVSSIEKPVADKSETTVDKEPVKEVTSAQVVGTFTEYEIYELAKIVYCEAGGESQKCREYVAQVVLNRINSPKFPNTVHDVILQRKQFSPTFDGSWERKEPNQASYDAVYTVLNSSTALTNALFFESCKGSSWHSRNLTEVAAIDNTRFYTY